MGNKLEVNQDKEDDEIVIKDFDDVFDYIGGWGPFQVINCVVIVDRYFIPEEDNCCLLPSRKT